LAVTATSPASPPQAATCPPRNALVFGATGFVGRHLILALSREGVAVTAAVRSEVSYTRMAACLQERGCPVIPPAVLVDFDAPQMGQDSVADLADITELYNCAGAYRFGMSQGVARHANVDAVAQSCSWLPAFRSLHDWCTCPGTESVARTPTRCPGRPGRSRRTYTDLGAYEASKVESDAVFQHAADRARLPWSIVNPSTVSGVSSTGETDQFLGLADTLHELWRGTLPARPGSASTFVPVVPVDHLASFMTRLPVDSASVGQSYWVLDDRTPPLHELLDVVGHHYQVSVPRSRVPVGS
jgi:nucleoside-diphosphate-sugar epimerase